MIITPLRLDLVPHVRDLMKLGDPFIRVRTDSDYWLYARLFSSSCPVAMIDDTVIGAAIAFRSQDNPADVYIQDVMTHPAHRRTGAAAGLLHTLRNQAAAWGCARLYLTSEPENTAAHATWTSLGFINLPGDTAFNGVTVIRDFKGPGKDRAVYQFDLP